MKQKKPTLTQRVEYLERKVRAEYEEKMLLRKQARCSHDCIGIKISLDSRWINYNCVCCACGKSFPRRKTGYISKRLLKKLRFMFGIKES